MFIVDAEARGELNGTAPIRDLPILDAIERMQIEVNNVPNTTSISLVDILKAIHVDSHHWESIWFRPASGTSYMTSAGMNRRIPSGQTACPMPSRPERLW